MHDLANEIIAGLHAPKRSFGVPVFQCKSSDWQLQQTRADIIGATKVSISDNLLEHAINASFMRPQKMFDILHYAIPPFENLWIEWNASVSVRLLAQFYKSRGFEYVADDEKQKCGYLIQRTVNGNFSYSQFILQETEKPQIFFSPCSAYISHDPTILHRQDLKTNNRHNIEEWGRTNEIHNLGGDDIYLSQPEHDEFNQFVMGTGYHQLYSKSGDQQMINQIIERVGIGRHPLAYVGYQPFFNLGETFKNPMSYTNEDGVTRSKTKHFAPLQDGRFADIFWEKAPAMLFETTAGDLRLLMTIISLWNYPNHVFEKGYPKTENSGIKWGKRIPKNEVRTLDIELPKPDGVKMYEKMFRGFGAPKRQHLRRGHWRHLHKQDGSIQRIWINEQLVGDPSLGVIDHNYNLERK